MHNWISRYRAEGASSLSEDGNEERRSYSEEIRQKAVAEYLSGQGSSMVITEKYLSLIHIYYTLKIMPQIGM